MAEIEEVGVEAVVKGFAAFLVKLEAMNKAIAATGVTSAAAATGAVALRLALAGIVLVATGVALAIGAIVAALGLFIFDAVGVAKSIESAFAGVAKTTDGLIDEFGRITQAGIEVKDEFRDLAKEVPLALEELLKIGEFAGQLGIAKENLADFSEVVAALGVSTELSTEEAAIGLARLGGIYEITIEDMVENTQRLGDTIVFLGNNFKTNEPLILNFAKRIAGIAKFVNISQAEILGFGAAFTSAGVEAQLGGTALQNTILAMSKAVVEGGDELATFAEVSGKSSEAFVEAWEDDAANAVVEFLEGLGGLGENAFKVLEDVGLASDRTERALLPLAAAGDLLRDAIEGSNQAWEDNNALARETAIRYNTLDSQLEITKNQIRDFSLAIGDPLKDAFKDLLKDGINPFIEELSGPLITAFEKGRDAVVNELLPAIGDLLDSLGFDITTSTLIDGIANLGDVIAEGVGDLADFTEDVANLVDIFNEGGASATLAEFLGVEEDTASLILDAASALVIFGVALKGIGIAAAIGGGVLAAIPIVLGALSTLTTAIGVFLLGGGFFATIAGTLGISLGAAIAGAFSIALAGLIAVILVFGEDALRNLINIGTQLGIIWDELWEQFLEGASIIWDQIVIDYEAWLQNLIDSIGITDEIQEEWRILWEDMQEILNTILPPMLQTISDFVDDVLFFFSTGNLSGVPEGFVGVFEDSQKILETDTFPSFKGAIKIFLEDITTGTIREEAQKWPTEIEGTKPKFQTAGRNIMQGLLDGLKARRASIIRFITDLAGSIVSAIKGALNSDSPSKVFRDIGIDINLGLAKGILESVKFPQLAMEAVADRTIDAGSQFLPGGRGSTTNTDRSFNPTINATYANQQSPSDIASDLSLVNLMRGG